MNFWMSGYRLISCVIDRFKSGSGREFVVETVDQSDPLHVRPSQRERVGLTVLLLILFSVLRILLIHFCLVV